MLIKEAARFKRHRSIRKRIIGSQERPRVCVHRSAKNLFVQVIDDVQAKTILSFSTLDKAFLKSCGKVKKVTASEKLGDFFGKKLLEKGIKKVAFDRGGYLYHGRIKALADSLRKAGLEF